MKSVRYTKFTGDLASEMSMDDLLKALSDYLLDSGFQNPYAEFQDLDQTMEDLTRGAAAGAGAGRCVR